MESDPVATYRLQLTADFGFGDAEALIPYLVRLGVSHVYLSPVLQAAKGSLSGYDVVDPNRISRELGGEEGFRSLSRAAVEAGLSLMVDIVPNHLAISDDLNPWWRDVLENGLASRYATFFDVDWEATADKGANQVLLPVLGDHFGRILDQGKLGLRFHEGVFEITYEDRAFPVDPVCYGEVLRKAAGQCSCDRLAFVADSYSRLPQPDRSVGELALERHRNQHVLGRLLQSLIEEKPEVAESIGKEVDRINADREELAGFIERQNYRLAFWRIADADLGYRRFFNINDLIGVRVETEEVFQESHRLPVQWLREGAAHALRVDHPDGLRDPTAYFERLRSACPKAWIVVEKILEAGEELPEDWPVEGTTGYDFLNLVNGVFVDPSAEEPLTEFYETFSGQTQPWESVAETSKREALTRLLGSDLNRLADLLQEVCVRRRRHRDHTLRILREALVAVATAFPVYRTYVRADKGEAAVSPVDEQRIRSAIDRARKDHPEIDAELLSFLQDLLLLNVRGQEESEFVMRFQQLTGPAMAKGLEDTAFYRYHRFVSLNEVGGEPGQFGTTRESFHQGCQRTARTWPLALLSSSTHDTKRSEDVRARLDVLSEIPHEWTGACRRWQELNRDRAGAGTLDRNAEYLLYQTMVGAWPIDSERTLGFMQKAVREAKQHTAWTNQNSEYEEALESFVKAVFEDEDFLDSVDRFVATIQEAGWLNGLSQTLLKLTAPGVPDVYQGCELWDYSLVDPDNRRPVDYAQRQEALDEATALDAQAAMERLEQGIAKIWLIQRALEARRSRPRAFSEEGGYEALEAVGAKQDHAVAFCRGGEVTVVVGRWFKKLQGDWGDTRLPLPAGVWKNALGGAGSMEGSAAFRELLATLPVALLVRET